MRQGPLYLLLTTLCVTSAVHAEESQPLALNPVPAAQAATPDGLPLAPLSRLVLQGVIPPSGTAPGSSSSRRNRPNHSFSLTGPDRRRTPRRSNAAELSHPLCASPDTSATARPRLTMSSSATVPGRGQPAER